MTIKRLSLPTLEELAKIRHPATPIEDIDEVAYHLVGAEQVNKDKDLWKAQIESADKKSMYFISPLVGSLLDQMIEWSKAKKGFYVRKDLKTGFPYIHQNPSTPIANLRK